MSKGYKIYKSLIGTNYKLETQKYQKTKNKSLSHSHYKKQTTPPTNLTTFTKQKLNPEEYILQKIQLQNEMNKIQGLEPLEGTYKRNKPNEEPIHKIDFKLQQIEALDEKEPKTFLDENPWIDEEPNPKWDDFFLYHAIRYHNQLERLENIFLERKILAANHLPTKFYYSYYNDIENCNEGEYVSLLAITKNNKLEYDTFIRPNISFIISPFCEAIKTVYISYDLWEYLKKHNITVKNRFSYAKGEYQVKDHISLEWVRAIGIPYLDLKLQKGFDEANNYKDAIINLMEKYNIKLPIVDTSCYNNIIYEPQKEKKKTLAP